MTVQDFSGMWTTGENAARDDFTASYFIDISASFGAVWGGFPHTCPDFKLMAPAHNGIRKGAESMEQYARKRGLTVADAMRAYRAIEIVSARTGIDRRDILGKSRLHHIAHARQLAYAEARAMGLSLEAIGRAFGRHHTSVMHGLRQIGGKA